VALVAGLVLVLGAVGVTIAATAGGSADKAPRPTATATTTARPITTATAATSTATAVVPSATAAVVTADAMGEVLQRYVDAYGGEDLTALGSLFAPELRRVDGVDAPEDLSAAMDSYARQFSRLSGLQYSITDIAYDEADGAGGAAGSYRITSDSGVSTGTIAFGFRVSDDGLLINHIEIEPTT
jgi:hypothetical protein